MEGKGIYEGEANNGISSYLKKKKKKKTKNSSIKNQYRYQQ